MSVVMSLQMSEEDMQSFDANKVLPKNVCLKSVDNHLYRIGLSFNHYSIKESVKKRDFLHSPTLIVTVFFIQLIKSITNLLVSDQELFVWDGDFSRVVGVRIHFNFACILFSVINLSWIALSYSNYINGIEPEYPKVFQMMSGQIPPKMIGLIEQEDILFLIKRTRILFSFAKFNNRIIALACIFLTLGT